MDIRRVSSGLWVRMYRGEKVMASLASLVERESIASGVVSGLGALMQTQLGFFHLDRKEYDRYLHEHEAELTSLVGNLAWLDGKPAVHCHVTLGAADFRALAGHLFEAEVAVTVECMIWTFSEKIERQFESEIGLNLLRLCPSL